MTFSKTKPCAAVWIGLLCLLLTGLPERASAELFVFKGFVADVSTNAHETKGIESTAWAILRSQNIGVRYISLTCDLVSGHTRKRVFSKTSLSSESSFNFIEQKFQAPDFEWGSRREPHLDCRASAKIANNFRANGRWANSVVSSYKLNVEKGFITSIEVSVLTRLSDTPEIPVFCAFYKRGSLISFVEGSVISTGFTENPVPQNLMIDMKDQRIYAWAVSVMCRSGSLMFFD